MPTIINPVMYRCYHDLSIDAFHGSTPDSTHGAANELVCSRSAPSSFFLNHAQRSGRITVCIIARSLDFSTLNCLLLIDLLVCPLVCHSRCYRLVRLKLFPPISLDLELCQLGGPGNKSNE